MHRLFYLHQHYLHPSHQWGGIRSHEFAKRLSHDNFSVLIIASDKSTFFRLPYKQSIDNYTVLFIPTPYSNNLPFALRILSFVWFSFVTSLYLLLNAKSSDKIFATSTPLTIAIPALIAHYIKGVPYFFEVRDLWPEMPIALGALKNRLYIKAARFLEYLAYKKAQHVIFLSTSMRSTAVNMYNFLYSSSSVIENSCDVQLFVHKTYAELSLDVLSDVRIVYIGSLGVLNNLLFWLESLVVLRKLSPTVYSKVHIDIYGDGSTLDHLTSYIRKNNLMHHVSINSPLPKNQIFETLHTYHYSICSFLPIEQMNKNSSNKFFDSLAAYTPILMNYKGWQYSYVSEFSIGHFVGHTPYECATSLSSILNTTYSYSSSSFEKVSSLFSRQFHYSKLHKLFSSYSES